MSTQDPTAAATDSAQSTDPAAQAAANRIDGLSFVMDVPVEVTIEIGRRRMKIADILRLGAGAILELTKAADEPLDVYVNNRLIARGEAVVVGDHYGVRITEVLTSDEVRTRARGSE